MKVAKSSREGVASRRDETCERSSGSIQDSNHQRGGAPHPLDRLCRDGGFSPDNLTDANHPSEREAARLVASTRTKGTGEQSDSVLDGSTARTSHGRFGRAIAHTTGDGDPLPLSARRAMEARFGASFDDVRIHTSHRAGALADAVDATAFAHGRHLVFGTNAFRPHTSAGRELLAHELVHVLQWRAGSLRGSTVARVERNASGSIRRGRIERARTAIDRARTAFEEWRSRWGVRTTADYRRLRAGGISKRAIGRVVRGRLVDEQQTVLREITETSELVDDISEVWELIERVYCHDDTLAEERKVDGEYLFSERPSRAERVSHAYAAQTVREATSGVDEPTRRMLVYSMKRLYSKDSYVTFAKQIFPTFGPIKLSAPSDPDMTFEAEFHFDSGGGTKQSPWDIAITWGDARKLGIRPTAGGATVTVGNWGRSITGTERDLLAEMPNVLSQRPIRVVVHDDQILSRLVTNRFIGNALIGEAKGIAIQFPSAPAGNLPAGALVPHLPGNHSTKRVRIGPRRGAESSTSNQTIPKSTTAEHYGGSEEAPSNGLDVDLLVDTGAEVSMLRWKLANRAGITAIDHTACDWDQTRVVFDAIEGLAAESTKVSTEEEPAETNPVTSTAIRRVKHKLAGGKPDRDETLSTLSKTIERWNSERERAFPPSKLPSRRTIERIVTYLDAIYTEGGHWQGSGPFYPATISIDGTCHEVTVRLLNRTKNTSLGAIGLDVIAGRYHVGPGYGSKVIRSPSR